MRVILFFILLSFQAFSLSYVSMTESLSDEGYEVDFRNRYFISGSIFNHDGTEVNFADGESYSTLDSELWIKYGLTDQLEAFAAPRFRFNSSSSNATGSLTKSGVESIFIGFNFSSKRDDGMQYKLTTYYRKGMYTTPDFTGGTPTEIALGDDGNGYYIGVAMSYMSQSSNFFDLSIGYHNASPDLSAEIVTDTRLVAAWDPVALMIGVDYVYTLGQDPYESDTANKPQISRGTTFLWNSINRTYTDGYLGMNVKLGQFWRLESKLAYRVSGVSTDRGLAATISFVKRKSSRGLNFKNKDNAFKQYEVDGIVMKVTKSRKAVVVNRGVRHGLKKGDKVDFYHFDYVDGDELIGVGVVVKSSYEKSIVRVAKKYSKRRIKDGTVIRSGLIKD